VNRRWRGWALYGLAWVPILIGYTNLLLRMRGLPLGAALEASFVYVTSAALLGALVWHTTDLIGLPEKGYVAFIGLQIVLAATYSLAWLLSIVMHLMIRSGVDATMRVVPTFTDWQFVTGVWIYGVIAGVSYALRATGHARERDATTARAESLRLHAELEVLRGHLNPHFLFGTLHTVSELSQKDRRTARLALERLIDLLRYVLDARRLEALDCVIPSLMLQPLVENAIKHGISPRASGGTITIGAALDDDELIVVIADDGPGAVEEGVRAAQGLGLRVGRQRLETRYPKSGRFIVTTAPGAGFTVTLRLPATIVIVSNSYPVLPVG
jgi:two-component system, LytTR family, sensor kinase